MQIGAPGVQGQNLNPQLFPGVKLLASVISSDDKGNIILNINGTKRAVQADGLALPAGKVVRVEVLQTEPEVKVRILPETLQNSKTAAALISDTAQKDALLDMKSAKQTLLKSVISILAKEAVTFSQKEVSDILKNLGGARIASFLPEEIKKAVRNGGNFFENKLLKGISPGKDAKALAYSSGNDAARGAVTKMQIANILMNADVFTFFGGDDDLDFDNGVMRFRKTPDGDINLYMKVDFTNLGETIISFAKAHEAGYYVTVRTEKDISGDLSSVQIPGLSIRWAQLGENDASFFEIKNKDFVFFDNFDMKA